MNLYKIRGGTEEELYTRQYQIGVGISLGNKWFSVENITSLVIWSLKYSKDLVIVYVADSIHAINLEVRKRLTRDKAAALADEMGTKVLREVEDALLGTLSSLDFNRIRFAKWNEITDQDYLEKLSFLEEKYISDSNFIIDIENIVKNFTKDEVRKFDAEQIHRLGDYLIQELPECLYRVKIAGNECDAFVYPYDGELPEFIENLQKGLIYPEIREKVMDTKPKVFITVR